jgi:hypothetical protein
MPPIAVLLLVAAANAAPAAESAEAAGPVPLDRWGLALGGFRAVSDTTISARAGIDEYTAEGSFNLEDDLGLDQREPVAHARFEFLTTPHQQVVLDWFGYTRENELSIARSITYDGHTYDASARVLGRIDYDFGAAAYRWWFGDGATVWGLGAGLAYYRVDTLLEGEATFEDESVYAATRSSDDAFAPLLTLGWRYAPSERWRLYAELAGVAKQSGALNGHIVDGSVGVEWWPWRRVGLALEYGHTKIRLVREREYYDARLDLTLRGPSLFVRLR